MSLTVNGERRDVSAGETLAGLLHRLGVDPAKVAVERNRAIAPRSSYGRTLLSDGDELEIVHFVGGG